MREAVIELDNLSVGYGHDSVVSDISLDIERGEICAIIGSNGSGKSTILKTLAGVLPKISGSVRVLGREIGKYREKELAGIISCMFPTAPKTSWLCCGDIVENGRYPYTGMMGILSGEDRKKTEEAMELTGVTGLKDKYFNTLSDGQKQRVMLARAICQEPEIMLLDEPASFLDIRYKLELLDLIKELAGKKKITVVFSMHEISFASRISHRMICLKDGKVDRVAEPSAIMDPAYIEELYGLKKGSLKERELHGIF